MEIEGFQDTYGEIIDYDTDSNPGAESNDDTHVNDNAHVDDDDDDDDDDEIAWTLKLW